MPTDFFVALLVDIKPAHLKETWAQAHLGAINNPRPGFEQAIVFGLRGWLAYADIHVERYERNIGDDGVLGEPWAAWGDSLRQLLNGETGRLDCGTIDSVIHRAIQANGFDPDNL